jgi:hypothetical protein
MRDASEEQASECEVDHGFGTVDAFLIVSHQAAPAGHPSEGALDDPAAGQDFGGLSPHFVESVLKFTRPAFRTEAG